MYVITHTLSPVILSATGELIRRTGGLDPALGRKELIAIGLAGGLADCLYPHLSRAARLSSFSHTAWFAVIFSLAAIFLARRFFPGRPTSMALLMAGAYWWHLFCDLIAGGIAPLWPFSTQVIGRYYVPPTWWFNLDIICIVLTIALALVLRSTRSKLPG